MKNLEEIELFNFAMDFAMSKHENQLDKSGEIYFYHCVSVMNNTVKYFKDDVFMKIVALLHDTIEDTDTTYNDIVRNFGQSVADHVNMLTRREDMSYIDYINSLKYNEVCRKVKIADLLHNMDLTRLDKITKKDIERNRKYLKALEILIDMER